MCIMEVPLCKGILGSGNQWTEESGTRRMSVFVSNESGSCAPTFCYTVLQPYRFGGSRYADRTTALRYSIECHAAGI